MIPLILTHENVSNKKIRIKVKRFQENRRAGTRSLSNISKVQKDFFVSKLSKISPSDLDKTDEYQRKHVSYKYTGTKIAYIRA